MPIDDNSLKHLGILSGDMLVVKITKYFNEANLYVCLTPVGQMARYGATNCAKIVLSNSKNLRETFFRSEVEMLGMVVRVGRDLQIQR